MGGEVGGAEEGWQLHTHMPFFSRMLHSCVVRWERKEDGETGGARRRQAGRPSGGHKGKAATTSGLVCGPPPPNW